MNTYEQGEICAPAYEKKFILGKSDLFRITRVLGHNRYNIIGIVRKGKITRLSGRIFKDISGEHLRKIGTVVKWLIK